MKIGGTLGLRDWFWSLTGPCSNPRSITSGNCSMTLSENEEHHEHSVKYCRQGSGHKKSTQKAEGFCALSLLAGTISWLMVPSYWPLQCPIQAFLFQNPSSYLLNSTHQRLSFPVSTAEMFLANLLVTISPFTLRRIDGWRPMYLPRAVAALTVLSPLGCVPTKTQSGVSPKCSRHCYL